MEENLIKDMGEYLSKAFTSLKPAAILIGGWIGYIMFPDKAYFYAMMAVIAAAFMDIITKSYCICKKHGGFREALEKKELFSKTLWKGTEVKIISYLTISILTGLSYRVIYLKQAGIMLGTFVYSVMFMREFQSNVENLIEAGADLHWLLLFSRKKNKELMDKEGIEEENEVNDDYESRI